MAIYCHKEAIPMPSATFVADKTKCLELCKHKVICERSTLLLYSISQLFKKKLIISKGIYANRNKGQIIGVWENNTYVIGKITVM